MENQPETIHHQTMRCTMRGPVARDTSWDHVTCDDCHDVRARRSRLNRRLGIGVLVAVLLFISCTTLVVAIGDDGPEPPPVVSQPTPSYATSQPIRATSRPEFVATVPAPAMRTGQTLTLLRYYRELQGFKDNPDFHFYCYGVGGPYNDWVTNVKTLDGDHLAILLETGIVPGELWQMGRDYCQNEGRDTSYTISLQSQMKPEWLAMLPGDTSMLDAAPTVIPSARLGSALFTAYSDASNAYKTASPEDRPAALARLCAAALAAGENKVGIVNRRFGVPGQPVCP